MPTEEFGYKLFNDLERLDIPVDEVDVYLRPYSKTYFGRYFPMCNKGERPKIYVYPYEKDGSLMSYDTVFKTLVHEFCHHRQYSEGFTRLRGVMHDSKFWSMYNSYIDKAEKLNIIGGESNAVSV